MKTATVRELKIELSEKSNSELVTLCLSLSKFKKENKELLTYLLYEKQNEEEYIASIKEEMIIMFQEINRKSLYLTKKNVRKILRIVKKYIRYSKNKETEVELLLFYCKELKFMNPSIKTSKVLHNIFDKQIEFLMRKIAVLHEDLRFDFNKELEEIVNF